MPPSPKESPESPGYPYELSKGNDTILEATQVLVELVGLWKKERFMEIVVGVIGKKVSNKIGTEDDQIYKVLSQKSYRIDGN